jgi:hypothetical protein
MCNFPILSEDEKASLHTQLLQCAESFGGKNHFLHLLESIRETKPHPLMASSQYFKMEFGTVRWDKVIFSDKLQLLIQARTKEGEQDNFLPSPNVKGYKKILNVVRTLAPITFKIKPREHRDGEGFTCRPFVVIDEHTTKLDPIFDILFFCSIDTAKKLLAYTPPEN